MTDIVPIALSELQFPSQVAQLPLRPSKLYLCGSIPTQPMVAIVGTRRPTTEALSFAHHIAGELVSRGFAIASGGAAGIDTAAHRGALDARGKTLVIAPSGWNQPYPEENRALFEQIVSVGGGYVSIVEPDVRPMTGHFFSRNTVMVAMSHATVVVQAPLRSGARNAAHAARKLGRLLFAVPSAPWVEQGQGCLLELKLGARLFTQVRDLLIGLSEIGVSGNADPLQLELKLPTGGLAASRATVPHDAPSAQITRAPLLRSTFERRPELAPVLDALINGCSTIDSICVATGWSPPKVQQGLLQLTLDGLIQVTSAGRIEAVTYGYY